MSEKLPRILVTGGSGFIGYNVVEALCGTAETHYTTFGHPISIPGATEHSVDLRIAPDAAVLIDKISPDVLIHTAGLTRPDHCEKDWHDAYLSNVRASTALANAVNAKGGRLVFLSTDLVFDGDRGGYREDDRATPLNNYGWTNLMAEAHVGRSAFRNTVLRCALTYGWGPEGRHGFNGWMLNALQAGEKLQLFSDEYRTPLYVGDLIEVIRKTCLKSYPGLFHVAGRERISRYDFGVRFAKVFGFDPGLITAVSVEDHKGAPRAKDVSLNADRAAGEFEIDFHAVLDGLESLKSAAEVPV